MCSRANGNAGVVAVAPTAAYGALWFGSEHQAIDPVGFWFVALCACPPTPDWQIPHLQTVLTVLNSDPEPEVPGPPPSNTTPALTAGGWCLRCHCDLDKMNHSAMLDTDCVVGSGHCRFSISSECRSRARDGQVPR